jgi:tRNA pseudouridine55 synthase
MNGVLIVDKAVGLTSHDVVAQLRHVLHERRIGHTGTLDPFASGVLAMLVGRATRLAQFLSGLEKEYEAVIRLGHATDTGDLTGQRIKSAGDFAHAPGAAAESAPLWTREQIEAGLASLRGEIDQVPPMFSAKKQGGRRLYELARRGEEVERKPAQVCIYKFEPVRLLSDPASAWLKDNRDGTFDFAVRVACSAGTYVRTLAEDFGKRLGVGAHLAELRRTRVGEFSIAEALTLEQVKVRYAEESLGTVLYAPDDALRHLPFVNLNAEQAKRVLNGIDVQISAAAWSDGERVRLRDGQGNLIAVGEYQAGAKALHPSVVIAQGES